MQLIGSKKFIGGLALAGTMALTGIVGNAQQETAPGQGGGARAEQHHGKRGGHGMRGGFAGHFAHSLNLTDAQKEQMRQIAARYRESTRALREQGRAARDGQSNSFNGGVFDETAVRAAAQARANARVEMEVAHARMMSEMYAVLTPEQKAQLAAERQQREQKRQERRARRGINPGQIQ